MTENVYLFVPNLIGYGRILLAIISFYYMPTNHILAALCYIISTVVLDEFDGFAARTFGQCSQFGAMLDMLTDRCATMGLLAVLCMFYPSWAFFFQVSVCIDIASHWLHLHSSMMSGSESHKKIDLSGNFILRHYYTNGYFLSFMCAGNEGFYTTLYLLHFTLGPVVPLGPLSCGVFTLLCVVCAPVALVKSGISLVHLYVASENITAVDMADRRQTKSD